MAKACPIVKVLSPDDHLFKLGDGMTCYFRHLKETFRKAGIEVTSGNKKEIDEIIHNIVGTSYKNCPATWKEVKKMIAKDERSFVEKLKQAWTNKSK